MIHRLKEIPMECFVLLRFTLFPPSPVGQYY